jgi:hypothetical protein
MGRQLHWKRLAIRNKTVRERDSLFTVFLMLSVATTTLHDTMGCYYLSATDLSRGTRTHLLSALV